MTMSQYAVRAMQEIEQVIHCTVMGAMLALEEALPRMQGTGMVSSFPLCLIKLNTSCRMTVISLLGSYSASMMTPRILT